MLPLKKLESPRNKAVWIVGYWILKLQIKTCCFKEGDANIELEKRGYRAQDAASSTNSSIKILGGTQGLVQVWPNPSIQPKEGNYAENVISQAAMYYGTPYEFSSDRSDPSTFDCSDFTHWVYLSSSRDGYPKRFSKSSVLCSIFFQSDLHIYRSSPAWRFTFLRQF